MDDIWRKAAKKIRENDRRVTATHTSQPEVKPTVIATSTAVPTYTNTSAALNTVAQCDARLLQMEFEWKLNRSGPFPHGIRNAIANLRAALVIREAEASKETTYETTTATIPAPANAATPTTTSAPANTAAPRIYETITPERLDRVANTRHIISSSTPIPTTTANSNTANEQDDEQPGVERDKGWERRTERREGVTVDPAPSPTNRTMVHPVLHVPVWFDWAGDVDADIGLSLIAPAPANLNRTPPAPNNCTSDPAPTVYTVINPAPMIPLGCAPNVFLAPAAHVPRDLSGLCSGSRNPWGSLSRRRQHSYSPRDISSLRSGTTNPWASLRHRHCSRKPRQPINRNNHSFIYPSKISIQTPLKPIPSPLSHILEKITHPLGIGPMKPVIRVPISMPTDTSAHPTGTTRTCHAVIKSIPPSPQLHSMATVKCLCGRLVPVSDTPYFRTIPLYNSLTTFISRITSYPLFFPAHLFSCFRFQQATRASP